jgi:hypothetical protein
MTTPELTPDRRAVLRLPLAATLLNALPIAAGRSAAAPIAPETMPMTTDPVHDFDSHFGAWQVRHRRLKERLAGSTEWIEYGGTCMVQPILGGAGNMDDNIFNMPGGAYRGVSVRAFDPQSQSWAIWWLDGRFPHTLDVPVIGRFKDDIGIFLADDTFKGKPIKVRYIWSHITLSSRRWEQAFSPDGGQTWETNWISYFTRTA